MDPLVSLDGTHPDIEFIWGRGERAILMDNGLRKGSVSITQGLKCLQASVLIERSSGPQEAATSPLLSPVLEALFVRNTALQGDITLHNRPICRPGWSLEPPGCATGEIRLPRAVASWAAALAPRPRGRTQQ